jgi:hypothetical protein
MGEEKATEAAAAQPAANQQSGKPMFLVSPFFAFVFDVLVFEEFFDARSVLCHGDDTPLLG